MLQRPKSLQPQIEPGTHPVSFCHIKVREVAISLAGASYEALMSSGNYVYQEWKRQHPGMGPKALERAYVKKFWPKHIEAARATMALLLREPIDEKIKEEIMEALVLDKSLQETRVNPRFVTGQVEERK